MKLILILLSVVAGLLGFSLVQHTVQTTAVAPRQMLYHYQSENIGYSDIAKLYETDSSQLSVSFFQRRSLQQLKINIDCQVVKTIIDRLENNNLRVIYQLSQPRILADNNGIPIPVEKVISEISLPVQLEVTPRGEIISFQSDPSISNFTMSLLKEIVARFQFTQPPSGAVTWENNEDNVNGVYRAGYRFTGYSQQDRQYEKKNLGYSFLANAQDGQAIKTDSRIAILTDSLLLVKKMNVSESQVTQINQDTVAASGTKIMIELIGEKTASRSETVALKSLVQKNAHAEKSRLFTILSREQVSRMAYQNTLGSSTWEGLAQELVTSPDTSAAFRDRITDQFRALAYLYPAYCEKIGQWLIHAPVGSRAFEVLSTALARTKQPDAATALAHVIVARKTETAIVLNLLPVLTTCAQPSEEAMNMVKGLCEQREELLVSTAQLTLGGMTYHMNKNNPAKARPFVGYLLQKMEMDRDTMQQLMVLGNTGSQQILPVVKRYINGSTSVEVKMAAIAATRFIRTNEVEHLLRNWSNDRDTVLSKPALEIIAFRKNVPEQ